MSIDLYAKERVIEQTRFSMITKVTHVTLGPVAIKIDYIGVLKRELLYLKRLFKHPNVIHVYGTYNERGADVGFVMELINQDLRKVIETRAYGSKEIYSWFYQVCSAFSTMHEIGHMHRDIKPANMLLNEGLTTIKVIDFGISREESGTDMTTRMGTPAFMAPEVLNHSDDYTSAADVYSLGVTVFVTSTKQSVWNGRSWDWNMKIKDPSLQMAVDKMVEKEPTNRPSMRRLRQYFEHLSRDNICDETLLEPESNVFESVEKLEDGEYMELPCYGPEDFLDDKEPLRSVISAADTMKIKSAASFKLESLKLVKSVGRGNFAECILVGTPLLGRIVFKKYNVNGDNIVRKIVAEKELPLEITAYLTITSHPNIVQFYGTVYDQDEKIPVGFLMEHMENKSIYQYYTNNEQMNPPVSLRNRWSLQVATALSFLHSHDIAHRDLTPNNILLSGDIRTAKICDFGTCSIGIITEPPSIQANEDFRLLSGFRGTASYVPPEFEFDLPFHNIRVDLFSFGRTLFYIYSRLHPTWKLIKNLERYKHHNAGGTSLPGSLCKDGYINERLSEIILSCDLDPELRPTAAEAAKKLREIIDLEGKKEDNQEYSNETSQTQE